MSTVVVIDDAIQLTDQTVIQVETIKDLARLTRLCQTYLDAHGQGRPQDRWISSIEARELARARGHAIPTTTLVNAYKRGNIADARKAAGSNRWESSEAAFVTWLNRWIAHR